MSVEQLKQAKELALTSKNPQDLLVQVVDTTFQLIDLSSEVALNFDIINFGVELLLDTLQHPSIPKNEHQFIILRHVSKLVTIYEFGFKHFKNLEISMINIITVISTTYESAFNLVATTSNKELWDSLQQMDVFFKKTWKILTGQGLKFLEDIVDDGFLTYNQVTMKYRHTRLKIVLIKYFSKVLIINTFENTPSSSNNSNNNGSSSAVNGGSNNAQSTSSQNTTGTVCLSIVSDSHPVIRNKSKIDNDAKKLLDMLLSYLIDEEIMMCTQVFQSILTNLVFIMQKRPQSSNKIFQAILKFNIDKKFQFIKEDTLQYRLSKRFTERQYKNFVNFCFKTQILNKSSGQIINKLTKIASTLQIINDDLKQKGILEYDENLVKNYIPLEVLNKYDNPKNVVNLIKLKSSVLKRSFSNMNSFESEKRDRSDNTQSTGGRHGEDDDANNGKYIKQIYTPTNNKSFDLSKLPKDVLIKLSINTLMDGHKTQPLITKLLESVINYTQVSNEEPLSLNTGSVLSRDNKKQKLNTSGQLPTNADEAQEEEEEEEDTTESPFLTLAKTAGLNAEESLEHFQFLVENILHSTKSATQSATSTSTEHGSLMDKKDTPSINILIRLACKGIPVENIEYSNIIREKLYEYVIEDFSNRMDHVISWMNEEWFYEADPEKPVYNEWCNRIFNGIIPFVDNTHRRQFIRLVSELPSLTQQHVNNFKSLCLDPLRNSLGFVTLKFIIMFRPPVKPIVKTFLTALKEEHAELEEQCAGLLNKM